MIGYFSSQSRVFCRISCLISQFFVIIPLALLFNKVGILLRMFCYTVYQSRFSLRIPQSVFLVMILSDTVQDRFSFYCTVNKVGFLFRIPCSTGQ
jgi:hypothetical protein